MERLAAAPAQFSIGKMVARIAQQALVGKIELKFRLGKLGENVLVMLSCEGLTTGEDGENYPLSATVPWSEMEPFFVKE